MNINDKQEEKSKLEQVRELKIRIKENKDLLNEKEEEIKDLLEKIDLVDTGLSNKSDFIRKMIITVTKNIAIMFAGAMILTLIGPSIAATTLFALRLLFIFGTSYKLNKEENKVVDNHHKNKVSLTNTREYLSLSVPNLMVDKIKITITINECFNEINNINKDPNNYSRYQVNESLKANILEDENNLTFEDFKKPYVKK